MSSPDGDAPLPVPPVGTSAANRLDVERQPELELDDRHEEDDRVVLGLLDDGYTLRYTETDEPADDEPEDDRTSSEAERPSAPSDGPQAEPDGRHTAAQPSANHDAAPLPEDGTAGPTDEDRATGLPTEHGTTGPPALEMRQIAGLTSGSAMALHPGKTYEFSESTKGVSFAINVLDDGQVIVLPGSATCIVNEIEATEPTFLGDGILQVGSACFSVRPVRPPATGPTRLEVLQTDLVSPGAIVVPAIADKDRPVSSGGLISPRITSGEDFLDTVRRTRSRIAEGHRLTHPDPEEIKNRLARLEPDLWERGFDHPHFGRFSVAYATIPWQPRFDTPELIPERLHRSIIDMSLLPWVPITADLRKGPLGIVGTRAAVLACSRHAILSLATLTAPGDIGYWVVTGRRHLEDWQWTTSLPISMSPEGGGSFMIAVVDGMNHFEKAGLDMAQVEAGEIGLIALASDEDALPERCGCIIRLQADGSATITNHLGESIPGTPIGVTKAFALDMATRITDILAGLDR